MVAFGRFSDTERAFHYALTQSRVLGVYFWRVLVPSDLCSDHHIAWTKSWSDGPALVGLALVIAITLIVLNFACRHRSWFAVLCGLVLFHLYLRFGYSVDELMVESHVSVHAMDWLTPSVRRYSSMWTQAELSSGGSSGCLCRVVCSLRYHLCYSIAHVAR